MDGRHRHVIVGGGFAGLRAARVLANRDDVAVTVVNPQSNFEYHGSLYRSANGYSPLETVIPYREIFQNTNTQYTQDFMVDINPTKKRLKLLSGHEMSYDSATFALGYEPEYFGIPGMREFSKTLYSLADALALRKALKSLAQNSFHKSRPAKIIVVGGGPTGIEVAASIPHFFEIITGDRRVDITIIEAQDRVLSALPPEFSEKVTESLEHSISVICNLKVIRASKELLHIADQQSMPFDLLIWTAGSSANSYFNQRTDLFGVDRKGRVVVDGFLQTKHDDFYVVGDSAAVMHSGTAHAAIEMGGYVAKHIIAKLEQREALGYGPTQPNYAVPVGHEAAVASKDGQLFIGNEGWQIRRDLDLWALQQITSEEVAHSHWEKGTNIAEM